MTKTIEINELITIMQALNAASKTIQASGMPPSMELVEHYEAALKVCQAIKDREAVVINA